MSGHVTRHGHARSDVVCFSIFDWWHHGHGHSDFQLMMRLAEDRRVLLVNSIGMRMPTPGRSSRVMRRFARKARSTLKGLRTPLPQLPQYHVFSPLILPAYGDSALSRKGAALVAFQVRAAMRRIRIVDPLYVITVPTAWEVVRLLEPRVVIYNRSDKHSAFSEADTASIKAVEQTLLLQAHLVLYASSALREEEASIVGDRALFLDHGIDLAHFGAPRPEPRDVSRIPRPRLGFLGELRDRVIDFDLLAAVAKRIPDAQLILVGAASDDIGRVARLPNVHWLGFRDYSEIPAFAQALDVGLLPYRQTEWVRYVNPVKLKEYLACGLPVVSTDFPAVRDWGSLIAIAGDTKGFVDRVRRILETPADVGHLEALARRRLVASCSWSNRVELLDRELARLDVRAR